MNLYNDIYQLVRENDCVIIPDFGGFIANYFEANINFNSQEFFPPSRKIAFNENLINNDGLLLNFISNKYCINWNDAKNEVQKFVEEIKNELNRKNVLVFGNIGSFKKRNGLLEFFPNAKDNFLDNSFGLPIFNYPMLKSAISTQTIVLHQKLKSQKEKKTRPLWIGKTIAAAVAAVLFISVQFDVFNNNKSNDNVNYSTFSPISKTIETNNEHEIQLNDTNSAQEQVDNIEEINETIISPKQELEIVNVQTEVLEIKAYTIAGSFFDYENAEKLQHELISKGFSSTILPYWKGKYRVTIKSYPTKENAIKDLENIRTQSDIKDLWVLFV